MGKTDNGSFHNWGYSGTSTCVRISSMMRSPASARRCSEGSAGVDGDAMGENRHSEPLHIVRYGVIAAFHQGEGLHGAVKRL